MKPLEMALESSRPILVIANDIQGDALQGLVLNRVKGSLRVSAIKSPGFGASRHDMLLDLQAVIGGKVLTQSFDMSDFKYEDFGTCEKIIISRSTTMLISKGEKDSKKVMDRIQGIKSKLSDHYLLEEAEQDLLNYRLAQLSGGISILRVGAATESELIERYDRVDDALNATKAALQEGILPGGGVALVKCIGHLKKEILKEKDPDIIAGMQIMCRSISSPFNQIILNGNGSASGILTQLENQKGENIGYDSRNKTFGNMYELGIVDPHKVVRCAIENATSAASMLLNAGCCMIDVKQTLKEDN
jgi:chaperonin GroEL